MIVNLSLLSNESLASRFETLCLEQHRSLDREEIAAYNRRYKHIDAIIEELKSRSNDERRVLQKFYQHRNSQVALTAAYANLAIDYEGARRTIEEIADSGDFPQAGDAGMASAFLDDGTYKPT